MKKTYSSKNSKAYSKSIIQLLKDFGIECTEEQKRAIKQLPTEEAVDRYKNTLLKEVI